MSLKDKHQLKLMSLLALLYAVISKCFSYRPFISVLINSIFGQERHTHYLPQIAWHCHASLRRPSPFQAVTMGRQH